MHCTIQNDCPIALNIPNVQKFVFMSSTYCNLQKTFEFWISRSFLRLSLPVCLSVRPAVYYSNQLPISLFWPFAHFYFKGKLLISRNFITEYVHTHSHIHAVIYTPVYNNPVISVFLSSISCHFPFLSTCKQWWLFSVYVKTFHLIFRSWFSVTVIIMHGIFKNQLNITAW